MKHNIILWLGFVDKAKFYSFSNRKNFYKCIKVFLSWFFEKTDIFRIHEAQNHALNTN